MSNKGTPKELKTYMKNFLNEYKGKKFKPEDFRNYLGAYEYFTEGQISGILHRTLRQNAIDNSIEKLGNGQYLYDPDNKKSNIKEHAKKILDKAFEDIDKYVNSRPATQFTNEELDDLKIIKELYVQRDAMIKLLS